MADSGVERAVPGGSSDRELLQQAADALWNCAKSALTVKPSLDQPYRDAPEWTPYTRWVERPARNAHDLAMVIRKHLKSAPLPAGVEDIRDARGT